MKTKRISICIATVILLLLASVAVVALADSEPTIEVKYCNVSLDDGVDFWYSVSGANIPADAEVGITVRKNSPSSGEILTAELKQKNVISSGTQYIFSVDGLSLDEMTVELYATPYVKLASGEMIYGEAKKSSVLEYAYRVLGKVGNGSGRNRGGGIRFRRSQSRRLDGKTVCLFLFCVKIFSEKIYI